MVIVEEKLGKRNLDERIAEILRLAKETGKLEVVVR